MKSNYQLIKDNEGMIYKIANKYRTYYNMEDLYQVGCIGIIKAYKNYNQLSECKFSSYAYKYILGEIIEYIRGDRNIKVSEEYIKIYKRYESIKNILLLRYEREPSFKEICSFMEISEEEMLNIIETVAFTKSFESTYENDFRSENHQDIDSKILLYSEVENLSHEEQLLIYNRYYNGYNQSEVANIMGWSQAKVSREETRILKLLKQKISS